MASRAKILAMLQSNASYATTTGTRDGVGGAYIGGAYIGGCEGCGKKCMHCGGTVIGGRKKKVRMAGAAYHSAGNPYRMAGAAYIGGRKKVHKKKMHGGMNEGLSNYVMWRSKYLKAYEKAHGVVPSKAHVSKAWKQHKNA